MQPILPIPAQSRISKYKAYTVFLMLPAGKGVLEKNGGVADLTNHSNSVETGLWYAVTAIDQ
jgi:hypothetical protein